MRPIRACTAVVVFAAARALVIEKGQESGFPPLRLPFQDLNTGNHIAQWVEQVDRAPCSVTDMSGCGMGERCTDGYCIPVIQ